MVNADNCQSGTSSYFLSLLSILFISEKYAKFVGLEPGLTGKTFIVQVPVSNSNFYKKCLLKTMEFHLFKTSISATHTLTENRLFNIGWSTLKINLFLGCRVEQKVASFWDFLFVQFYLRLCMSDKMLTLKTPGARFTKVLRTFRFQKPIRKTPTCLFCKAGLFTCCKGVEN